MVLPLLAVLFGQVCGFQNQKVFCVSGGRRVGEIETARDDDGSVNHHHLVVNCKLNHVT